MVRRTNKNDLVLLLVITMFAVITMTSFSACSTAKVLNKESVTNVEKRDSSFVKSTDTHTEVSASSILEIDSVETVTIHEVITIYDVVYDTTGMPVLTPSGEPMTYKKVVKDITQDSSKECDTRKIESGFFIEDTAVNDSAVVAVSDSTVVVTERSVERKNKSFATFLTLLIAAGVILLGAKIFLDRISG